MTRFLERFFPRQESTFRHGVHPEEHKDVTGANPVEPMPFVAEYVVPLGQHIGAPAKSLVVAGERVERGQQIAEPRGYVSTAHHAPVTGTVVALERRPHPSGKLQDAIVLRTDPYASQRLPAGSALDPSDLSLDEVIERVQQAGIVGLGGAAFPSHVKLRLPEGKTCKFVVINGCECEPYLSCDHRLMAERPQDVVRGTEILMGTLGAERAYIGIERNKPDAIQALRAIAPESVQIISLQVKYPQGAEKMLIDAIFAREVPDGGLPLDLEMVVNNVGTMVALADLFDRGLPLIERVVTVSGSAVARPRNLLVPLGTPIKAVLDHCGLQSNAKQVILGGPMMGFAQKRLDVPVLKGTSGILAFDRVMSSGREEYPCIRCARCLEACPLFLNPTRLALLARAERPGELVKHHVKTCFECAACSYACPSTIPLVQWIRLGKGLVRQREAEEKALAAES
jgi:electron transport complex protein RnfC